MNNTAPSPIYEDETYLKLLKVLEINPQIGQRELSKEIGVSLGKVNYCLKSLLEKGLVKAENFKKNNNKLAYTYILTPHGIIEKSIITARFLQRKMNEYEQLKSDIANLTADLANSNKENK